MTATRPAAAAPVETAWGQDVHDATFTPFGCNASSALITGIGTTVVKINMTVGGPNLNANDFLVPANGAGVYFVSVSGVITALGAASNVRGFVYKNGVAVAGSGRWESVTVAGAGFHWCGFVTLAVGDRLALMCSGGSGTSGMSLTGYMLARRIGDSLA